MFFFLCKPKPTCSVFTSCIEYTGKPLWRRTMTLFSRSSIFTSHTETTNRQYAKRQTRPEHAHERRHTHTHTLLPTDSDMKHVVKTVTWCESVIREPVLTERECGFKPFYSTQVRVTYFRPSAFYSKFFLINTLFLLLTIQKSIWPESRMKYKCYKWLVKLKEIYLVLATQISARDVYKMLGVKNKRLLFVIRRIVHFFPHVTLVFLFLLLAITPGL